MPTRFQCLALCDLYSFHEYDIINFDKEHLSEIERDISDCKIVYFRDLSCVLTASKSNKCVTYDGEISCKNELRFKDPRFENASCIFYREFDSDRFLNVHVRGDLDSITIKKLGTNGIVFGGRQYSFLGGEGSRRNKKKCKRGTAEYSDSLKSSLVLWFFATHEVPVARYSFQHEEPALKPMSVTALRNWLGHFVKENGAKDQPTKINARLKLGFSNTLACLHLDNSSLEVIDDIHSTTSHDHIVTDGCGFISSSLLTDVPYAIHDGAVNELSACTRGVTSPTPAVVQVRITSSQGLFKGCLLVTNNETLCPAGCVRVRKSMRKGLSSLLCDAETHSQAIININQTFERPSILEFNKKHGTSGFASSSIEHCARLNKDACLLLRHLGVPEQRFKDLMQAELDRVLVIHSDREAAYRFVRRARKKAEYVFGSSTKEYNYENNGDDDEDDTTGELDGESYSCSAERAHDFLLSGHSLQEPMLRQLLREIQIKEIGLLQKCNIRVPKSIYLVGAPDPLGVLQEGEVFISLPSDREYVGDHTLLETHEVCHVGRAVVSRHPMHHPGDIRVMTGVHHPELAEFLSRTNGGVIFFSTKGNRSAGDMMGGGDYDGDEYLVLYGKNDDIVRCVKEVKPFVEEVLQKEDKHENKTTKPENNDSQVARDILWSEDEDEEEVEEEEIGPFSSKCSITTVTTSTSSTKKTVNSTATSFSSTMSLKSTTFDSTKSIISTVETWSLSEDRIDALDPISAEILDSLLDTTQSSMVGRYSNAWLKWADLYSPEHPCALDCDKIIRSALDASKKGACVNENTSLLGLKKPHHMVTDQERALNPTKRWEYHSVSIVGVLFDMAVAAVADIRSDKSLPDTLIADPQISIVRDSLGLDIHAEFVQCVAQLNVTHNDVAKEIAKVMIEARSDWRGHCGNYKNAWSGLIGGTSSNNSCQASPVKAASGSNSRSASPAHSGATSLFGQNAPVFAVTPNQSPPKRLSNSGAGKGGGRVGAWTDGKGDGYDRVEISNLKNKYTRLFVKDAEMMSVGLNLPLDMAKRLLAVIIYNVTYEGAKKREDTGKYSLSFCWEVCGTELHYIKRQSQLLEQKQHPDAVILKSERRYT